MGACLAPFPSHKNKVLKCKCVLTQLTVCLLLPNTSQSNVIVTILEMLFTNTLATFRLCMSLDEPLLSGRACLLADRQSNTYQWTQ